MTENRTITVYGASGHTGKFVVAELRRRGWTPVLSGRDLAKLEALAADAVGGAGGADQPTDIRPAGVDSPAALDRALQGSAAVINCAGPFRWTAGPVVEAALRAGIPYLDVAAEIEAVADTLARYDGPARDAGLPIVPAMAFYGGLGDLLVTAATPGWTSADEVTIAYGLSSWQPTAGTLAAGRESRDRREGRRVAYRDGELVLRTDAAPVVEWTFPPPLGRQQVNAEFTMADSVTIPRHLPTPVLSSYMTVTATSDLADPASAPPVAVDELGRSDQTFLVDVVARSGDEERRAHARGQDIYAITAPLVVEAAERVLAGRVERTGALTAGQAFDAADFLRSLPLDALELG